jgi:hypothetical protein
MVVIRIASRIVITFLAAGHGRLSASPGQDIALAMVSQMSDSSQIEANIGGTTAIRISSVRSL